MSDYSGMISAMNADYNLSVKDGQMTEEAWDALQKHLYKIEQALKALQESDKATA